MPGFTNVRDTLPDHVLSRRRHVEQVVARELDMSPLEMDAHQDNARDKTIEYLIQNDAEATLSLDYFQWRVDLVMWLPLKRKNGWQFPYLDKEPETYGSPVSLEYKDALAGLCYERPDEEHDDYASDDSQYSRIENSDEEDSPISQPVGPSRGQPARSTLGETAPPATTGSMPDFARLTLSSNAPSRAPAAPVLPVPGPAGTSAISRLLGPEPTMRRVPKPTTAPKASVGGNANKPEQREGRPAARTKTYSWSAAEANKTWQEIFGADHPKFQFCDGFTIRFPARRSLKKCLTESIGRTHRLLNNRLVHIVWERVEVENEPCFWQVFVSPASAHVNAEDARFRFELVLTWNAVICWIIRISDKNQDVDFAEFFAEHLKFTVSDTPLPKDSYDMHAIDDFLAHEYNIMRQQIRERRAQTEKNTAEAKKHIRQKLLGLATVDFQDRAKAVENWILNPHMDASVDDRRKLVHQVWQEVHRETGDKINAINSWFWSKQNLTEPTPWPSSPE